MSSQTRANELSNATAYTVPFGRAPATLARERGISDRPPHGAGPRP